MLQQQGRGRRVPPLCCRPPGLRPGSGGRRRPPCLPSGWAGPAPGSAPQIAASQLRRLVSREAAVQGVVDVVGLGYAHHEVGGRAGTGRRRGAPGRAQCSTGSLPGSECSRPRARCGWPGPRCSRCWGEPSSLTVRRPWGPGSARLRAAPPSTSGPARSDPPRPSSASSATWTTRTKEQLDAIAVTSCLEVFREIAKWGQPAEHRDRHVPSVHPQEARAAHQRGSAPPADAQQLHAPVRPGGVPTSGGAWWVAGNGLPDHEGPWRFSWC